LGALHAFRDLGRSAPEDVGLVGFDDHEWADIFTPPLTVIRQPTFEMGFEAAKKLVAQMKAASKFIQEELTTLTGELIVRGSCSEQCSRQFYESIQSRKAKGGVIVQN